MRTPRNRSMVFFLYHQRLLVYDSYLIPFIPSPYVAVFAISIGLLGDSTTHTILKRSRYFQLCFYEI